MHTLKSPTALVEAIPSILGFPPVDSLVLVVVRPSGAVGCVLRVDLDDAVRAGTCARLASLVGHDDAEGVVAVIVSRDGALCPVCGEQYRDLIGNLAKELREWDVLALAAVVTGGIEAGSRWHCVDGCGAGGVLADPASSVVAAEAVAGGRRLYRDRDELKAVVTSDAGRAAALAPLLAAAGPVECVSDALRAALTGVHRVAEGAALTDTEVAGIGATLTDVRVRDRLFTTADSDAAAPAETLWTLLARVLPQPWRAEALMLLAFSAYLRGDGPLAGVALEAAVTEVPAHRLAGLMDTALQSGLRPSHIRSLLASVPPVSC